MKIDNRLQLVVPVERDDGTIEVTAQPISREVYALHYMTFAKCFTGIYEAAGSTVGARIAAHLLKDIAKRDGVWSGARGVEMQIFNEIGRTSIVKMADGTSMTLHEAIKANVFDEDDLDYVENAICFFIVVSRMHTKKQAAVVMEMLEDMWGARLLSSTPTAQTASSQTSTATDNSGETARPVTDSFHPS